MTYWLRQLALAVGVSAAVTVGLLLCMLLGALALAAGSYLLVGVP